MHPEDEKLVKHLEEDAANLVMSAELHEKMAAEYREKAASFRYASDKIRAAYPEERHAIPS